MRAAFLFYLFGLLAALLAPVLLPQLILPTGLAVAIALLLARHSRLFGAMLAGVLWASWHIHAHLSERPDLPPHGEVRLLSGAVVDFPQQFGERRVIVLSDALPRAAAWRPGPRVRVSINGGDLQPQLGQWCVLYVRLRPARGLANEGAADRERRYTAAHVVALARVIVHPANRCAAVSPGFFPGRLRALFSAAIEQAVPGPAGAVVRALAVADRSALSEQQWAQMRATGTNHLLAISGLHVSLCALCAFGLVRALASVAGCRRQRYPAYRAAWLAAALAALGYTALAGFGLPALRALVMVLAVAAAALTGRAAVSLNSLLGALLMLASWDPLCLLAEGLWLSFAAVFILLWASQRQAKNHSVVLRTVRVHGLLSVGLAPLLSLLFGQLAVLSPLANLIAVPWCSLLVVPLVLAGLLVHALDPALSGALWFTAGSAWSWLDTLLQALSGLDLALIHTGSIRPALFWTLVVALTLSALPVALKLRPPGLVLLLVVALAEPTPLPPGAFSVTVFDVGQGLAVLVKTRRGNLLYDAGPRWPGQARGVASRDLIPALEHLGVAALDVLMISHGDLDHRGGFAEVNAALPVAARYAAPGTTLEQAYVRCEKGLHWRQDSVDFRVLHPSPPWAAARNNRSCVLLVSSPYGRVLLSGDIERSAEQQLLAHDAAALQADVLVVPHHGSDSSSTPAFITAVRPRWAIIAAGYGNRYGLPDAAVEQRYAKHHAQVLNTAMAGAITISSGPDGVTLRAVREQRRRFWAR